MVSKYMVISVEPDGYFYKYILMFSFSQIPLDHNFYIYSMCMPFAGIYYFKLEKQFTCPTMSFLLFKQLPKFALNLWMMQVNVQREILHTYSDTNVVDVFKNQDMITSSTQSILTYVTNTTSESSDDDTMIDKVKTSPKKNKKKKNKQVESIMCLGGVVIDL